MKKIGGYAVFLGILLIVLPFVGLELKFFSLIDGLGETTAWIIKLGLIIIGAILFILSKSSVDEEVEITEKSAE